MRRHLHACQAIRGDVAPLDGETPPLDPQAVRICLALTAQADIGDRTHHGLPGDNVLKLVCEDHTAAHRARNGAQGSS